MPARIPSLNWLRVFEAAARTGSFARAGEILAMSAPAVSQQIKALETHLGRALFHRGPRSVELTEVGRAFLPSVAQSLHAVELASANLFGDRDRAVLRLQVSLLFGAGWLAARLPHFEADHPEIQVNLLTGINDNDFSLADADLSVQFGKPAQPGEDSDPLFGETLYPVAPPAVAQAIRSPEDLLDWPLIEIATHRANWFDLLPRDSRTPRLTYTDNSLTAYALAGSGAVALARAPASDGLPERFGLQPCLPDLSIRGVQHYTLVYPARSRLSRSAQTFRTWLLAEVEADAGAI